LSRPEIYQSTTLYAARNRAFCISLTEAGAFAASRLNECFQIEAWARKEKERRADLAADIAATAEFISLLRGAICVAR
jgi:chaperone required for assembly of F1-ATPase